MKALILGGTGMAGHMLAIYLRESGHDITVLSRSGFKHCKSIIADVAVFEKLKSIVCEGEYDVVINAIGILNKDADDNKSNAVALNSYLPHFLSEICQKTRTRVIHLSTDCVFSGYRGPYTENSERDGITFYARSKALGELENNRDLTFRTSIIGPDMKEHGIGLINWFMIQEGSVNGYVHAIWTGVSTLTLAKAIEKAQTESLTGLYHLVNHSSISKHELLILINKHMKKNPVTIYRTEDYIVDKSLINTRKDFNFDVPSYEEMIIELEQWIVSHKELYPHYFN